MLRIRLDSKPLSLYQILHKNTFLVERNNVCAPTELYFNTLLSFLVIIFSKKRKIHFYPPHTLQTAVFHFCWRLTFRNCLLTDHIYVYIDVYTDIYTDTYYMTYTFWYIMTYILTSSHLSTWGGLGVFDSTADFTLSVCNNKQSISVSDSPPSLSKICFSCIFFRCYWGGRSFWRMKIIFT